MDADQAFENAVARGGIREKLADFAKSYLYGWKSMYKDGIIERKFWETVWIKTIKPKMRTPAGALADIDRADRGGMFMKQRNELVEFIAGLAMLVVGLYLFTQRVSVSSNFFSNGVYYGSVSVPTGAVFIPFIIGIIMVFAKPESMVSKLVAGLGLLIILVSVIMSVHIRLETISLYEWILYLVGIFGGLGLLGRVLFSKPKADDK